MNNSQMHWYLIYTKPNQEIIAKKNLENQKYNAFLPIIRSYIHVSQAKKTDQPMFPRYLFIELSIENDHWLPVKSTKGVSHFINFDNKPIKVPNTVIESLKALCDVEGICFQKSIERDYYKGEKVIIDEGLLKGIEGIFLSKSSQKRVRLLLKTLSHSLITDIPAIDIGKKTVVDRIKLK